MGENGKYFVRELSCRNIYTIALQPRMQIPSFVKLGKCNSFWYNVTCINKTDLKQLNAIFLLFLRRPTTLQLRSDRIFSKIFNCQIDDNVVSRNKIFFMSYFFVC